MAWNNTYVGISKHDNPQYLMDSRFEQNNSVGVDVDVQQEKLESLGPSYLDQM